MARTKLHFEVSGSGGIPLLCVHGWGCNGGQFAAVAGLLGDRFRIYCPDLPGHGRTPLGDFSPSFDSYAAALADFARGHGLERPVLLGHSMGGVLSLIAAASGRLQPCAVINLDGSLPQSEKMLEGQRAIRGWLDEPDFRDRLAGALRQAFFLPSERDARCDEIIRTMCSAPDAVLRFLPEQVGVLHGEGILPRVAAPVLFVGSAAPRFDPAKAAALIRHLRLEQITHAGHFLHIYAPEEVAHLVKAFVTASIFKSVE